MEAWEVHQRAVVVRRMVLPVSAAVSAPGVAGTFWVEGVERAALAAHPARSHPPRRRPLLKRRQARARA